jgi:hypothetical protein
MIHIEPWDSDELEIFFLDKLNIFFSLTYKKYFNAIRKR